MKFVHIADMHFDIPFTTLNKKELGTVRRLEQRKILKQIVQYIQENQVEMLFIAGDLYEHDYVKQSTIEYINSLWKEIPNTNIYITPGNHDPFVKNSYYAKFSWNDNVHIFKETLEKVTDHGINIYGFGFQDFYRKEAKLEEIKLEHPEQVNILITHGSVDSGKEEDRQYNPMTKKELRSLGFDYIALGHIHKPSDEEEKNIVYPGSTMALGFDEPGMHGMIVGQIKDNKEITTEFIPLDTKEFIREKVEVDGVRSKEELIEKINNRSIEPNKYVEIILVGKREFEIDVYSIYPYLEKHNIIKIKDQTGMKIELEEIAKQSTLKGIFVKNMLEKMEEEGQNKEKIQKAIEIGLETM